MIDDFIFVLENDKEERQAFLKVMGCLRMERQSNLTYSPH